MLRWEMIIHGHLLLGIAKKPSSITPLWCAHHMLLLIFPIEQPVLGLPGSDRDCCLIASKDNRDQESPFNVGITVTVTVNDFIPDNRYMINDKFKNIKFSSLPPVSKPNLLT